MATMRVRTAVACWVLWSAQASCLCALAFALRWTGIPLYALCGIIALLSAAALGVAFRLVQTAQRQATAAFRRGTHLENVVGAVQDLWTQQGPADLLQRAAETARVVLGATVVTAYLPDPDDDTMLSRVALVPANALSAGPIYLPRTLAEPGAQSNMDGLLLVPVSTLDTRHGALLTLSGVPEHLDADQQRALSMVVTHAAHALDALHQHERMLAQASEDGLTGLLNHRTFQTRLEEEVTRTHRTDQPLTLMMIDLDYFGAVNNTYGHQVGDTVLIAVAAALRQSVRVGDVVARYGGDEFAVILPMTPLEEARVVAERTREIVAELPTSDLGVSIRIDASIGLATLPTHASKREELVRAADQAAYAAKHAGKGRIACPEDALVTLKEDSNSLAVQLEHANMATVKALAAAVDAKDPYTRGHSQRVSVYAAAIATALELSSSDVERVRLAGLLHDVGKIGVPDAILTKSGPLSEAEFDMLQQHPVIGERMLAAVPFLDTILPAVRHHHERWDGNGYPDGLAGSNIPPDATIVMVADAFDAMTTSRPYRPALPLDEARRRVQDGSGTQFDPRIARAFALAYASGQLTPLSSGGTKLLDRGRFNPAQARASTRHKPRALPPWTRREKAS